MLQFLTYDFLCLVETTVVINTTPVNLSRKSCVSGAQSISKPLSIIIAASINILQTGLLAGIAVLTVITLLAVTLLFAMCVYVRCSHQQQSGLYSTKFN